MWGFEDKTDKEVISNNANNANSPDAEKQKPDASISDVLEGVTAGDGKPQGGDVIDLTDGAGSKPKRRGRPPKDGAVKADDKLKLFSEEGVGKLWVNSLNGLFGVCGAEKLSPDEAKQQSQIFAHWCKSRFPDTSDKYQPDILLAASLLFAIAPRIGPIAKTTAPWWKKLYLKMRGRKEENATE